MHIDWPARTFFGVIFLGNILNVNKDKKKKEEIIFKKKNKKEKTLFKKVQNNVILDQKVWGAETYNFNSFQLD